MKFQFLARCGEDVIPLEVELAYQPGNQSQRARRLAVGQLLAGLEAEQASIDASGQDRVIVTTEHGDWVIGEGGAVAPRRGAV